MMMMMMIPPLHHIPLQTVNYSAALCFLLLATISGLFLFLSWVIWWFFCFILNCLTEEKLPLSDSFNRLSNKIVIIILMMIIIILVVFFCFVYFVNGILKVIFVYAVVCCVTTPLPPTQIPSSLSSKALSDFPFHFSTLFHTFWSF